MNDLDKPIAGRWSPERAWEWYDKQPWICGPNYVTTTAINNTEMWQKETFDPDSIEKELALAESVGFNCLRVFLQFIVWEDDPEYTKGVMDRFMEIASAHKMRVMWTLFDDCRFGRRRSDPTLGKQGEPIPGVHSPDWTPSPGHSLVKKPKEWHRLENYVKDVIGSFKDDERVLIWDLYNEPNDWHWPRNASPVLESFKWAREIDPSQPITVCLYRPGKKLVQVAGLNSDIITFHYYWGMWPLKRYVKKLKKYGRPMICTEWLHRNFNSHVHNYLPFFKKNNIGAIHWGLVTGKQQTKNSWFGRPNSKEPKRWQHDLFHEDHKPYDEREIELFREHLKDE